MKNFILALYAIGTFTLVNAGCASITVSSNVDYPINNLNQESLKSKIVVKVINCEVVKNRLNFKWEIINTTEKPIYIYSSLLENPAFAEIALKPEFHIMEIRFLRLELLHTTPYFFPKSTFAEIFPGRSLQGTYISSEDIGSSIRLEIPDKDIGN